jgi:hypothetical protein
MAGDRQWSEVTLNCDFSRLTASGQGGFGDAGPEKVGLD